MDGVFKALYATGNCSTEQYFPQMEDARVVSGTPQVVSETPQVGRLYGGIRVDLTIIMSIKGVPGETGYYPSKPDSEVSFASLRLRV